MDEITNDGVLENAGAHGAADAQDAADSANVSEDTSADTSTAQADEAPSNAEGAQSEQTDEVKKKKLHLPPKIQKLVDYINSHEDIRQMVFFLMFSILCGATQMIVTYALSAGLKLASALNSNFDWFVFHFATSAEFIGFLVGSIVGQVLTFVLNRKKTFNMPDYVVFRAVMYAILAILIIIMQTYLGGLVTKALHNAKPDANGFLDLVFNLTGQLVAGIAAMIINFLGNKFLVMRDWSKLLNKNKGKDAEAADNADSAADTAAEVPVTADTAGAVACDVQDKTDNQ